MSTKIYYGMKSNKTLLEVIKELDAFRDRHCLSGYMEIFDPVAIFSKGGRETVEIIKKNGGDESCVILFAFEDYTLAIPYFDDFFITAARRNFEKCVEWLTQETSFFEYGYWDNSDKPEEVSDDEWDQRCDAWEFLGYRPIKFYGLTYTLSDYTDFIAKGAKQMNKLIIDVHTRDVVRIVYQLKRLKSTGEISYSKYRECPECSQIFVETKMTEEQMDEWLYKKKSVQDYIGVVRVATQS